jgi:hypothetical protein
LEDATGLAPRLEDPYEQLTKQGPEDRIRAVLGLQNGHALPHVNQSTLLRYYQYLSSRLTLPFEAQFSAETEPVVYPVTVIGLVDPRKSPNDPLVGVSCVAHVRNKASVLPLVDIEVAPDSPNFAALEDYWYWLWNWRELHADVATFRPR